jgi:hypothetical protein
MPRWPAWLYDSKAHAAALSEGRRRRCDRYAGFSRGRAAQPRISRARERLADISPEERCHYASVPGGFIGQRLSALPLGRSRHGFSRRRRLFEARPGDEASRTTAKGRSVPGLAVLNGCFNIKGFGFRTARSKFDLNMAAITYDRTLGCRITEFERSPKWMERDGLPRKDGRAG